MEKVPHIELEIQGRPDRGELVPLRTFARATDSLTDLLTQIAADRPRRVKVDWFVSDLRKGSTVLEVEGRTAIADETDAATEIMQATVLGLAALESGGEIRGVLSYPALEKARTLANLWNDGAGGIVLRGFGQEVAITTTAADRAKELLARRFHSFGSVEGTVETVSIHEARPYFNVFHSLDGYAIKCRCDHELLLHVNAVLGSRIRVAGLIERRFDGRAESVEAAEFRVLSGSDQLPQVGRIRGIAITTDLATSKDAPRGAHD